MHALWQLSRPPEGGRDAWRTCVSVTDVVHSDEEATKAVPHVKGNMTVAAQRVRQDRAMSKKNYRTVREGHETIHLGREGGHGPGLSVTPSSRRRTSGDRSSIFFEQALDPKYLRLHRLYQGTVGDMDKFTSILTITQLSFFPFSERLAQT